MNSKAGNNDKVTATVPISKIFQCYFHTAVHSVHRSAGVELIKQGVNR